MISSSLFTPISRVLTQLYNSIPPVSLYLVSGLLILIPLLSNRSKSRKRLESDLTKNKMAEPHTIVILGASLGGLPIAHWLMKHTAPTMKNLKVVLVSPNTDFYWCLASVRAILPDMLPDEKVFFPIAPLFSKYPKGQFEFIVGKAETLDPVKRTVLVSTTSNSGVPRELAYDTLIVATGASTKGDMPWKNLGSTEATKKAVQGFRDVIGSAKSIVVAGGGDTGSEIAGELGEEYASKGLKEVTFIIDKSLPLTAIARNNVRQAVASYLKNLKVNIVPSARVTTVSNAAGNSGRKVLQVTLEDGSQKTLETDVYIPAFGMSPNSQFAPTQMLDSSGRFKQTLELRAEGHDNIFVIGDVGNLQAATGKIVDDQVIQLSKILPAYLSRQELPLYKPGNTVMFAVSLGKSGGTGQVGNFRMFSWLVWMLKCRFLGTQYMADYVVGNRTIQATKW